MKKQLSVLTLTLLASFSAHASTAGVTLGKFIRNNFLVCLIPKGDPTKIFLSERNGEIIARGANSREGKYFVSAATVNQSNLVVVLANTVDGPLASDALILNLNSLAQLGSGRVSAIQSFDAYSEGYDGTRSNYKMICHLED